jgi:hypothetical protein
VITTSDEISTIRASLPCSVEMPAGCGKTELIAKLARDVADGGGHCLVLTHTHSGVDALRRRFRRLGVAGASVSVRTIDSWCFDLIASYPQLAEIDVGPEPDWTQSPSYHIAGATAVASAAIERMLTASYNMLVVDEYQDCQRWQHDLIRAMAQHLPAVVFGDRLQGIFFFGDNEPVSWERDVTSAFPRLDVCVEPWRWKHNNPELGAWLLDARYRLLHGQELDVSSGPVKIVGSDRLHHACHAQPRHPMRTVVIAKWEPGCAALAKRLGRGFTMIEEVEGRFLREFGETIDSGDPAAIATATVQFAVDSAAGVAAPFDTACRRALSAGRPLTAGRFAAVPQQASAVNALLQDASPACVGSALRAFGRLDKFRLHRREAWHGMLDALRIATATDGLGVAGAVVQTRNRMRVIGRYPESRILARPALIKGLEFDYSVVTDPGEYNAHELYVCLTRGSRGLTVAGEQTRFAPARPIG